MGLLRQKQEHLPEGSWYRDLRLSSGRVVRVELDGSYKVVIARILPLTTEGETAEVRHLLSEDKVVAQDCDVWRNPTMESA